MTDNAAFPDLKLHRESTPQRVAGALRDLILDGDLPAGAFLKETTVAEQLDVSRNTVREAVQILISDGLVTRSAHRGAQVREPTPDDVRDLYKIRRLLECSAIREMHGDGDVSALRAALDALDAAGQSGSAGDIVKAELGFHEAVIGFLGSKRLLSLFHDVEGEIRLSLVSGSAGASTEEMLEENREVVSALEQGDRNLAENLLAAHLDRSERRLIEALEERGATPLM